MKKISTFALAVSLLLSNSLFSADWNVSTVEEFNTAWAAYEANDVIVFAEGTYAALGDRKVTKSVTLKAAPGATTMPVLAGVQFIMEVPSNFIVEGIESYFDEPAAAAPTGKYFLQLVHAGIHNLTVANISIKNSNLHGFGRGVLRADNGTNIAVITHLTIENSVLWDNGRNSVGYSTLGMKTAKISNATISNTVFYDSPNGTWNAEQTATPIAFTMQNCAFIKTTTSAAKQIITNKTNAGSVYNISNSIFTDSYDASADKMQLRFAETADAAGVTVNFSNTVFGNHFNTIPVLGPIASGAPIASTTLTYNYANKTIATTPTDITGVGPAGWRVNDVINNVAKKHDSNTFASLRNGMLTVINVPANATVEVFGFNGAHLVSKSNVSNVFTANVAAKQVLVRITSQQGIETLKVTM